MDEQSKKITNDCLNPEKYKTVLSPGAKRMKTTSAFDEYIKPTPLPKSKKNNSNEE